MAFGGCATSRYTVRTDDLARARQMIVNDRDDPYIPALDSGGRDTYLRVLKVRGDWPGDDGLSDVKARNTGKTLTFIGVPMLVGGGLILFASASSLSEDSNSDDHGLERLGVGILQLMGVVVGGTMTLGGITLTAIGVSINTQEGDGPSPGFGTSIGGSF